MTVGNQFVLGEDLPASMQEWKEGMEQYKNKICSGPSGTIYKVSPSADTEEQEGTLALAEGSFALLHVEGLTQVHSTSWSRLHWIKYHQKQLIWLCCLMIY